MEPQRRSSWLRNSMRKTRPIILPDPEEPPTQLQQESNFMTTTTALQSSIVDQLLMVDLPESSQSHSPLPSPSAPPLSLGSNHSNHSPTHDTFPIEFFDSTANLIVEERPRQLGRRAEVRPRLVAISAIPIETNTFGGTQMLTINHQERPHSAPVRITTTTAIPQSINTNTMTGQQASIILTQSNNSDRSEPSSVGSSRNPSPVSIASSTGSSSIVSTNDNNSSSRHHDR